MLKRIFSLFLALTLLLSPLTSFAGTWGQQSKPPLGSRIDWSHPLSKGLVGCWLMNEGGGKKVDDLSQNRNVGTLVNVLWSKHIKGVVTKYDGSGDYISISDSPSIKPKDFTIISSLFYIHTNDYSSIFTKTEQSIYSYRFMVKALTGGELLLLQYYRDNRTNVVSHLQTYGTGKIPTCSQWHTLAVSYSDSRNLVKMYVDGIEVYSAADTYSISYNASPLEARIGQTFSTNYPLNGFIEYCYFYSRALSPSEIQALYIDPYCFIRQDYRLYYVPTSAVTAVFRSQIINIQTW